jgi:FG-GAP-like repeat/PLAT/LH2 domain
MRRSYVVLLALTVGLFGLAGPWRTPPALASVPALAFPLPPFPPIVPIIGPTSAPHPFWVFAHNPNSEFDATAYLTLGVNALEPDIEFIDGVGLTVRHDTGLTSSNHDLVSYLTHLADLADSHNLALIAFDVKSEAAGHAGAGLELAGDIQTYLLARHPEIHVIMSVGSTADADSFFPALDVEPYKHLFAFQIDGEDDPKGEIDHLHAMLGADVKTAYGDGTAGCCGRAFPVVGPFVGPNTPVSLDQGVWVRTAFGTLNMVSYGFAVSGLDTIKLLIDSGVDGLIPSDFPLLVIPGKPFPLDTLDALFLVGSHYGGVYMATAADDPFSVPGNLNGTDTGLRQGYALEVRTATSSGAGTDANITFTLHGSLGDASVTMDSSWSKKMENGDRNTVFVRSGDLGRLTSVTVEQDGTGGLFGNVFGLGSKWDVDDIKVRSYAYIGAGEYPTPGDPNASQFEYNADFGGQTIDDNTPVTVALRSGIPLLATVTGGNLVLNMGPQAAARLSGDTSDDDENFTVHYVSTEPDASETVAVSAFGSRPQFYRGVRHIQADGGAGSDSLTVDGPFGIPIAFNGGANPGDQLVLQNATFDTVTHHMVNAHDGTVSLDPDGGGPIPATVITYTGLAPISDTIVAANRVFDFAAGAETITLGDDPASVPGVSRIDSTSSESVDFANPTANLTINASAGTGPDVLDIAALDPAFNAATVVQASNGGDHITVGATTGTTNTWTIKGGTGGDTIDVKGTNATTVVIAASPSTVTVGNSGSVQGITGRLSIENPTAPNTLRVDDSADTTGRSATLDTTANPGDSQTDTDPWGRITGLAPADIIYEYRDTASIDIRAGTAADQVLVLTTGTPTTIAGNAGSDTFWVGSTPAADNGDLDGIASLLTIIGGAPSGPTTPFANIADPTGQADVLYLNDRVDGGKRNYRIGDFTTDGIDNPAVTDDIDPTTPARAFAGVAYDATMDYVRVDGTDAVNTFDVHPSVTTQYHVDGNLPAAGDCTVGGGDFLRLDTTGTTGRKLHITGPGTGFWSFTSAHRPVDFESIERFNHVDIVATAPDSGTSSPATAKVYDAETGELLYQVTPFENSFKGGVQVATGDLNCDGIPELITAPGPGRDPTVKIYDGSPDGSGSHPGSVLASFSIAPNTFRSGANLAVGDVNHDGHNDLVFQSDNSAPQQLNVLDGRFLFTTHALLPAIGVAPNTFKGTVAMAVGDIDNDGFADIATVSGSGSTLTIKVYSGNGLGLVKTITPPSLGSSGGEASISIGDFDGDGHRDIIVGSASGSTGFVTVFAGTGSFANWPFTVISQFQPYGSAHVGPIRQVVKPTAGGNPGTVEKVDIFTATGSGGGSLRPTVRQASFTAIGSPPVIVDKILEDPTFNGLFVG